MSRQPGMLIAAAVTALIVTACTGGGDGAKEPTSGKTTITWWDYFGYSPDSDQAVNSLIKKYEDSHPDVDIQRTAIGFGDFRTKLIQAAASGNFPDIAAIDNSDVPVFATQGALADLTSKMTDWPQKTQYLDFVLKSVQYAGKYYGVPFRSNTTALWYNKDMFQEAGISSPPQTWQELRVDAKKLTNDKHSGICFSAAATEEGTWTFLPALWQAGGDVSKIGSQATVEALSYYNDLVNVDKSAPKSVLQWGQSDIGEQFGSGVCAMMFNGPWVLGSAEKGKFSWGVAPWPKGVAGTASPLGGEVWGISKKAANLDAVWQLADWLANPANSKDEVSKGLGSIPNRKDTLHDPAWVWHPMVKAFADQMPDARPRGLYGPKYAQISEAVWTMEQQVLSGAKSPQDAAVEAQTKILPLLS
ncbi:sugar ABC transporter substrate-binding protein [Planotetraspora sp. A-T 1434]|uniref:ABC transporter substrate-binding protein n=1 Tax=Planotetraspora sp. A-T 1434 TaxID=2979219 RepID=UPI0021C21FE7|nr:sugar ABC transporter substrate-binding protein [Planotetraspora sp. A-T 1434]MCT9929196.1 sugar ABC transporter substrate-binding protein [Planotetraspora sp. A-T 1434]